MSLKLKLTSTIAAFLLILGLTIMGVFAAPTATILLGGTISFKATDVHARVSGTITGSQEAEAEEGKAVNLETLEFSSGKETNVSSWADTDITFQDSGAMVTIQIVIENLATDRMLYASVADNMPSINNVTKTMKQLSSLSDATGTDYTGDVLSIPANSGNGTNIAYIQLTLQVTNPNASLDAGASYGYTINLNNENNVPEGSEEGNLVFAVIDETTKTAAASMKSIDVTKGDVVVPAYVTIDEQTGEIVPAEVSTVKEFSTREAPANLYKVTSIADYAFFDMQGCMADPDFSAVQDDYDAFVALIKKYSAWQMTSLTLPETLESIGEMAFYGTSALETLTLKKGPQTIGRDAFGLTAIKNVIVESGTVADSMFEGLKTIENVTLKEGVTGVGEYAFYTCSALANLTLPNSLTDLGNYAFSETGVTSVTIPTGLTNISHSAFSYCSELVSVTIPNTIKGIEREAFNNCSKLATLTLPNSVEYIESLAFAYCSTLQEVVIPDSVTRLGEFAFAYSESIKTITVGNAVQTINRGAFNSCASLQSMIIGTAVTSIGENVFTNSNALNTIYYRGTQEQWNNISKASFNDILNNITIEYEYKG